MESERDVVVGIVGKPHGLKGEVKVIPKTDDSERFYVLHEVTLCLNKVELGRFQIDNVKLSPKFIRLKFKDYDSCEAVESLRGAEILISHSDCLPTQKDQYYHFEIIGLSVFTFSGVFLGKVEDVIAYPANDVWVIVDDSQRECLVPAIKTIIKEVDLKNKKIILTPIDGLLDDFLNRSVS